MDTWFLIKKYRMCESANWMSACRRIQIDPYLPPYTKLNFKCIKDLNLKNNHTVFYRIENGK